MEMQPLMKQKWWERAKNRLTGKTGNLLFAEVGREGKVTPDPTFDKLNDILIGDPDTSSAIDFISDVTMGLGMETTWNSKYTEKTLSNNADFPNMTAKEVVDRKSEIYGLDQLKQEVVKDVVGYGNSVIWKGQEEGQRIRILPSMIDQFQFDDTGLRLKAIKTKYKTFQADEVIWYAYNRIGKTPIGIGILHTLGTALKYGGEEREAFATIKARIQQAMTNQIEIFSAPNQMWVLPKVPDLLLKKYHAEINKLKKGKRLAFNKEGASVIQAVPERMRGLDFYVEILWNSFYLALQTPLPKLFTTPGFTQASASAALKMGERKVFALQRYIKRMTEQEYYVPWLKEEGLDHIQASVRLNWRMIQRPDTNVLLPVLQRSREVGDLSQEEYRTVLAEMGVPIDPAEKVTDAPLLARLDEQIPRPGQPIESKEKTYKETEAEREVTES